MRLSPLPSQPLPLVAPGSSAQPSGPEPRARQRPLQKGLQLKPREPRILSSHLQLLRSRESIASSLPLP